jgi:hypothetical protein
MLPLVHACSIPRCMLVWLHLHQLQLFRVLLLLLLLP